MLRMEDTNLAAKGDLPVEGPEFRALRAEAAMSPWGRPAAPCSGGPAPRWYATGWSARTKTTCSKSPATAGERPWTCAWPGFQETPGKAEAAAGKIATIWQDVIA